MFNYEYGIPSTDRFIKVLGEDGTFYDLCCKADVATHIKSLTSNGYTAVAVNRKQVPACRFRDFTNGLDSYSDAAWKNGTDLYLK
jgi:hypothetical protein